MQRGRVPRGWWEALQDFGQGWRDTRAEDKETGPLAGNWEFIQALEQKDQIPVLTAAFTSVDCRDDQA